MHYIRLLRPPNVVKATRPGQDSVSASASASTSSLALVLTITTDLGESFLCPDAPINIAVEAVVDTIQEEDTTGEAEEEEGGEEDGEEAEVGNDDGASTKPEPPKTVTHVFALPVTAPTAAAGKAKPSKAKPGKPPKTTAAGNGNGNGNDGLSWKAGMRVLKLEAQLSMAVESRLWDTAATKRRICIRPADQSLSAAHARQLVNAKSGGYGLIMPLWVDVPDSRDDTFEHVALRRLDFGYGDESSAAVEVEEEIGESIARHVWDAGLVAVAYLADTCLAHKSSRKLPREEEEEEEEADTKARSLPDVLQSTLLSRKGLQGLQGLRVLELGSGVGILGIGLAGIVHEAEKTAGSAAGKNKNTFLLTDLPEAEERARANMARSAHLSLDYENLDWEDGRQGRSGPAVAAVGDRNWDLVVLSDCTYNVDMLPALVETLSALADAPSISSQKKPGVLLARKPRHASEEALFTLMKEHGWTVRASSTVPLPVLDNEPQVVELYLYEKV